MCRVWSLSLGAGLESALWLGVGFGLGSDLELALVSWCRVESRLGLGLAFEANNLQMTPPILLGWIELIRDGLRFRIMVIARDRGIPDRLLDPCALTLPLTLIGIPARPLEPCGPVNQGQLGLGLGLWSSQFQLGSGQRLTEVRWLAFLRPELHQGNYGHQ